MFESAELGHEIDKKIYEAELPALRDALLSVQYELSQSSKFPVVIIIGGVDGAGKGETVNLLNEWMDPRHIQTHAYGEPSEEESQKPPMWRFWRDLPPKGKIGVFFGSWYTDPIVERVVGDSKTAQLEAKLDEVLRFEKMLSDEGALILKFWMHLSKDRQKHRLKALEKDPKTRWRVTDQDWRRFKSYDKFRKVSELALRYTSCAEAPWIVVEGTDPNYRSLTVGKAILEALRTRLKDGKQKKTPTAVPPIIPSIDHKDVLGELDLSQKVDKKRYKQELEKYQGRLNLLSRDSRFKDLSVVVVFEGNDAAGKGGAIRRITGALDARRYSVVPVAAPTEEERAQPYLWRFWRKVPTHGRVSIFDRSWYGRLLVERVEGYCSSIDWMRAYGEINDFEDQMYRNKTIVVKFWLAISAQEQLKRFKERERTSFKKFKITKEDWRNRKRWKDYEQAVCDMVDHTSTSQAPWHLVEANDKYFARIKIMKKLCASIEHALERI